MRKPQRSAKNESEKLRYFSVYRQAIYLKCEYVSIHFQQYETWINPSQLKLNGSWFQCKVKYAVLVDWELD